MILFLSKIKEKSTSLFKKEKIINGTEFGTYMEFTL